MLNKIYRCMHRLASNPREKGEYSGGYFQHRIRQEVLSMCRVSKGRVIEVGCGEGLFLSQLAKQKPELQIWGIDNNKERLVFARERLESANIRNVNLSMQDLEHFAFHDEYFDGVICINVLFNLDSINSITEALISMKRICKKSGRIIFDFRNSLNPLLSVKYGFARYYDETVRNLPLRCYHLKQIESILKDLNLRLLDKAFIGSVYFKRIAPIIIIEAQKS